MTSANVGGMARDRTIYNDVVSDITSLVRRGRVEVLAAVERRRKWPDEIRFAIVAEALEPGIVVSHVARRHDINPAQLFGWLKRYRTEALALRASKAVFEPPTFATAVLELPTITNDDPPVPAPVIRAAATEAASIEISIGSATVRIRGAADAKALALVLKALRALA